MRRNAESQEQADASPSTSVTPKLEGGALPRPPRRPKRARSDRGLPDDTVLARLAEVYLNRQQANFPALAAAGVIPMPSAGVLVQMVEDYKDRHHGRLPNAASLRIELTGYATNVGGGYFRYSCENSNVTSIEDQLVKALDKGRDEGRFIHWQYVYADYSTSGLDSSRQGYSSYKSMLSDPSQLLDTTYIDDFTRASRDEIEWWRLAALTKRLGKRMVGASDNFSITDPNYEVWIAIFGLLSKLFIKSLREKVGRGMRGAARRGTCLGMLSLGFTKRPKLTPSGDEVRGSDGLPIFEPCIDPVTSEHRLLMYSMYVNENRSLVQIAKHFNRIRVDNWDRWTFSGIRQLLRSPTAIGVFIWNKTGKELNLETGKWETHRKPRAEWEVKHFPDRAIVPLELWRAARRKLAASRRENPMTGRKPTRNTLTPTTLFSGTLFCECCNSELKLFRSSGKYKQMGSLAGRNGCGPCQLTTSKSTKIIEECLLRYLRERFLSDESVEDLLSRANAILEAEAAKPLPDVAPLQRKVSSLRTKMQRLVRKFSETEDKDICRMYEGELKRLKKEYDLHLPELNKAESANRQKVEPLDFTTAKLLLADLRALLAEDALVTIAGPRIRELTGPILIRQEPIPGKKRGARWIATFTPRHSALLRTLAPEATSNLSVGSDAQSVQIVIDREPEYEKLAVKFLQLKADGASVSAIASAHGMTWRHTVDTLRYAETGVRPSFKAGKRTGKGGNRTKYRAIAAEVKRLHDVELRSFPEIAEMLRVGEGTLHRAYDYASPEIVEAAINGGRKVKRGRSTRLPRQVFETIRQLTKEGKLPQEIAQAAGCSVNTVKREQTRLSLEQAQTATTA